ncbi:MAG: RNA methyltransferase [Clostridia bacterium]|nr:RNA methyltransferase [Clostridia bacterium]
MLITSRNNPTVKKILSLQEKKYRNLYQEYLVEGEKMVSECIAAGQEITLLVLSESAAKYYPVPLSEPPMPLITVSDDVFLKLSGEKNPQGVLACVRLPQVEVIAPKKSCLLLDGVSDPGNLGTIIRTANAAGYEEIYLLRCSDVYAPKVVRASMSGVFHTKLYIGEEEQIFKALTGVPLVTADLNGENIFRFTPPEKYCLVIGNEGHGISKTVDERKAYTITIPMRKSQESLNAGVSAGIAMYVLKQSEFNRI